LLVYGGGPVYADASPAPHVGVSYRALGEGGVAYLADDRRFGRVLVDGGELVPVRAHRDLARPEGLVGCVPVPGDAAGVGDVYQFLVERGGLEGLRLVEGAWARVSGHQAADL